MTIIKTLCSPVHLLSGWSLLSPHLMTDIHMFSGGKDVQDARCVGGTFGWVDEDTVSENVTLKQTSPLSSGGNYVDVRRERTPGAGVAGADCEGGECLVCSGGNRKVIAAPAEKVRRQRRWDENK